MIRVNETAEKYCVFELDSIGGYKDYLGDVEKVRDPNLTELLYKNKKLFMEAVEVLYYKGLRKFHLNRSHKNAMVFSKDLKNVRRVEPKDEKGQVIGKYLEFEFIF